MPSQQQTKSLIHFCQREDLNVEREQILSNYRDRIQAGQRTKLTKDERQSLIDWFIESLKGMDNQGDIRSLCEAEIALLEEGYPQNTIASDILAKYRKAIALAIDEGDLPLTAQNSHHYTYTKRDTGEQAEAHEHYALTHLKYDQQTYQALRNQGTAINNERQDNLQPVQLHRYLEQLQYLLHSTEKRQLDLKLAIALAGATGRRHTEVLSKGRFTLTNHPYLLHFQGQQKKKAGEPTNFEILTILPAVDVIRSIERFRSIPTVAALQKLSSYHPQVKSFNVRVNRLVQKLFQDTGIVPVIPQKTYVSLHRLRGVYGAIAIHFFCPESRHEHRFLQNYLGHVLDEQVAPNSLATPHYFHYYLVDEQGNRLGTKGIKLAEFPLTDSERGDVSSTNTIDRVDSLTSETSENQALKSQPDTEKSQLETLPSLDFIDSEMDEDLKQSLGTALFEMFDSDSYTVILTALMTVTGRSPGELLKSATFEASSDPFAVSFSATGLGAKSRLKTLINAPIVLKTIQRLRNHPSVQDLRYQTPHYINDHCQLYVTQAINNHLPFDDVDTMLDFYIQSINNHTIKSQTELSLIADEDLGHLEAIAQQLNLNGSHSEIFQGLLNWVEQHLQAPPVSSEDIPKAEPTTPQDPFSDTPSSPSLDPLISQTLHHQAQTLVWLTQRLEAVESDQQASLVTTSTPDLQAHQTQVTQLTDQLEQLQQDNDSLSTQIEQLQAQVNQLNTENQDLQQSVQRFEAAKRAILGEQLSLPLEPSKKATTSPPAKKTTTTTQGQKTRKTRGLKGSAKQKALQITQAIAQWNQAHPDDTWAINVGLLETNFAIHRKAATEFIQEHHSTIDQLHHDSHVLDPRTHNRRKDTDALKAFVQPFLT